MDTLDIVAQVIGIVAMAVNILSFQCKTRSGAIAFQLIGGLLFSINFFMLGAVIGGILNAVAFLRAIIFLNKEKLKADSIPWLIAFILVYILSYILAFTVFGKDPTPINFVIELLPVIGMIASTLGFRCSDAKSIRRFGLISSPSWLIYNTVSGSVGAVVCEVLSLGSIIIGMIRYDRKK